MKLRNLISHLAHYTPSKVEWVGVHPEEWRAIRAELDEVQPFILSHDIARPNYLVLDIAICPDAEVAPGCISIVFRDASEVETETPTYAS